MVRIGRMSHAEKAEKKEGNDVQGRSQLAPPSKTAIPTALYDVRWQRKKITFLNRPPDSPVMVGGRRPARRIAALQNKQRTWQTTHALQKADK
jgi:hypothetical protein